MFITRHPHASFNSYMKLVRQWAPKLWYWTGNRHRFFMGHQVVPYDDLDWWDRLRRLRAYTFLPEFDFPSVVAGFGLAAGLSEYSRTKHNYARAILFEDLKSDPSAVMSGVFETIGVPLDRVPAALEELKKDSQQGHFGGMGGVKKVPQKFFDSFDAALAECESPLRVDMTMEQLRKVVY